MTDDAAETIRKRAVEVRQWADLNGGELDWLVEDKDVRAAVEKALWLAPDVDALLADNARLREALEAIGRIPAGSDDDGIQARGIARAAGDGDTHGR